MNRRLESQVPIMHFYINLLKIPFILIYDKGGWAHGVVLDRKAFKKILKPKRKQITKQQQHKQIWLYKNIYVWKQKKLHRFFSLSLFKLAVSKSIFRNENSARLSGKQKSSACNNKKWSQQYYIWKLDCSLFSINFNMCFIKEVFQYLCYLFLSLPYSIVAVGCCPKFLWRILDDGINKIRQNSNWIQTRFAFDVCQKDAEQEAPLGEHTRVNRRMKMGHCKIQNWIIAIYDDVIKLI